MAITSKDVPIAEIGEVLAVKPVSADIWEMVVRAPRIADVARAGQFVHVRIGEGFSPFLRRPLSIGPCHDGCMMLIFTVRGEGTRLLAAKKPGDKIDLIGPLGNPFRLPDKNAVSFLVAGGIGIVPLLLLDDQISEKQSRQFLLGIRTRDLLSVSSEQVTQRRIILATEDGSAGFHGNGVQLLASVLEGNADSSVMVYGCGPTPMMNALKQLCKEQDIAAQVSLEVPMGCGVGACQSCAVSRADGEGYFLVCCDGPVFDINQVNLIPELVS